MCDFVGKFWHWFMLPRHVNFDPHKIIGEGRNDTKIFLGKYGKHKVAVKRLDPNVYEVMGPEEIQILKRNPHENVIRIFTADANQDYFFIVYELCEINLHKYALSPSHQLRKKISEKEVVQQSCQGMNHLHKLKIIHGDLRPQNIMISDSNGKKVVKITDFCVKEIELKGFEEEVWLAPEMIESKKHTQVSDIYIIGLIIYFVLSKGVHAVKLTTKNLRDDRPVHKFDKSLKILEKDKTTDSQLALDLIERMTDINAFSRRNFKYVLLHPYFWNDEMRLKFTIKVAKYLEVGTQEAVILQKKLDQSSVGKGWSKKIDEEMKNEIKADFKYEKHSLAHLIRAINLKWEKLPTSSFAVRKLLGSSESSFFKYWSNIFPLLLPQTYQIVMINAFFLTRMRPETTQIDGVSNVHIDDNDDNIANQSETALIRGINRRRLERKGVFSSFKSYFA